MMAEPAQENEALFYDAVSDLAKTVEGAVYDIRIEPKQAGFRFSDLKGIGKYKDDFGLVERVAEEYLQATRADAYVFRASRNPHDYRRGTAIFENTSVINDQANAWKEYYTKKSTADFWIRNMQRDMEKDADFAVDMITRTEQLTERNGAAQLRDNIARRVGNEFFSVVSGVWREVYDALDVKENPELLYALAYTAEAEKRGYDKITGSELESVLRSQKISVHEFEHYTNRDLSAEQEEKTRAQQPATPAPTTQTVHVQRPARTQTAPATGGINANDIGAAIDAAERGETVRQTTPTELCMYTEPYVLRDVRCLGSDGTVFEQYAELRIQPDVVRRQNNAHRSFTPYQAIVHFETQGDQFLPSMALSCNVLVALFRAAVRKNEDETYTTLDEHAKQILDQYKDYGSGYGWHAQNTVVNWKARRILRRAQKSEIIHYPTKDDFPEHGGDEEINAQRQRITKEFNPEGFKSCTLEQACQNQNMRVYLQDFTGLQNPAELGEVAKYFGKTAKVWVSSENNTRAAWLGCGGIYDYLGLDAYDYLSNSDAARGVASNNAP